MKTPTVAVALVMATLLLPVGMTAPSLAIDFPASLFASTACGPTSADAEATAGTQATADASVAGTILTDESVTIPPFHDEQHVTGTGTGSDASAYSHTALLVTSITLTSNCSFPSPDLTGNLEGVGCGVSAGDVASAYQTKYYSGALATDDATGLVWFDGYVGDYWFWQPIAFPVVGSHLVFQRDMTAFERPETLILSNNWVDVSFFSFGEQQECWTYAW